MRRCGTLLSVMAALALAATWDTRPDLPRRFGVVEAGELYRSGEISPRQLAHLARERGVRTVISLLDPSAPVSQRERAAAERLGLRWVNIPLRGDGSSTAGDRARILEALERADNGPTLVHCAAGSNRTGLAIGLHRIVRRGWTVERAMEELRSYDFEDLPKHQNLRDALREAALRGGAVVEAGGRVATPTSGDAGG
ncbi:MAG: tyrosine-protein phosphatase [Planctomycetia bacterium]|nr:MAG: tyrosine-protein phosphatase [Planctomycetia bacterium]